MFTQIRVYQWLGVDVDWKSKIYFVSFLSTNQKLVFAHAQVLLVTIYIYSPVFIQVSPKRDQFCLYTSSIN